MPCSLLVFSPLVIITLHTASCANVPCPKKKKVLRGESDDSLLQSLFKMTQHEMMRQKKRFLVFYRRCHSSPSSIEGSFPMPLKYIDVTRNTLTSMDVLLGNVDDYWNADGERELSGAWTGFTRFIVLTERPPDGYTWSRWRLMRKQTTSRPDNVWPDMWKHVSDASKRKVKQKWAIEKPKLDNARQFRGIFFNEPCDEELKQNMKNARRKLEIPMPAAMPCKTPVNCQQYWETQDQICLYSDVSSTEKGSTGKNVKNLKIPAWQLTSS